tara:strand:+ start:444 stop:575 length:132 start_codon:yes stop_codon:yes gene_type:complete
MKVYVVLYNDYEVLEVVGVFADKGDAEKEAAKSKKYYIRESTL